jgi:transcriptional regulator with XRE-family HTH domain
MEVNDWLIKSMPIPNLACQPEYALSSTKSATILNFGDGEGMMTNTLGEKVRELRKQKGLSMEKLAELTESSKSYIWELENKNPPRPSADKIARIAAVLGVTADFLVDARESTPVPDVIDEAFFRKYRNMDPDTKEKIRQMVELWGRDKR